MSKLTIKFDRRISIIVLINLLLAACGGGSPSGYTPSSGGNPGTTVPVVVSPVPIVSISAIPTSVAYNGSTTVSWSSSNSTSCTSSGAGGTGATGSFSTGALTSTTTFTVTCSGAGGSTSQGVTVTVAPSSITHFADAGGSNVTVTSANTLSNGTIVTISGTTNYNGTYTVTNVTASSFRITATFNGDDATGSWTMAGGMISGCSTTGATGAISLSNSPSRYNGVAPLSVFFDAVGTTATAMTRPFHDLEYRWNFGDAAGSPVSGTTWGTGSKAGTSSRNIATGPVAAHVFETPGVYTVTLSATDGTNTVSNNCARIVVQDPDVVFAGSNTVCVAASSVPVAGAGGCPASASAYQQASFPTAVSTYALTGKRVLFKRGDTFTATTEARLTNTGPGILGSYGSGALPSITMTANTAALLFAASNSTGFSDWRVMDLAFDGGGTSSSGGVGASGGITQVTIIRSTFSRFEAAIGFGADGLNWINNQYSRSHTIDQLTVVDCTTTNGNNTSYSGYNAGNRVAFMGNYFENGGMQNRYDQNSNFLGNGTHVLRFPYLNKAVISHNHVLHPGFTRHAIKVHAPFRRHSNGLPNNDCPDPEHGNGCSWSNYSAALNGDGDTKYVIIADNYIASAQEPWQVAISPQDSAEDERLHDVILERNLHIGASITQLAQILRGREITSRNNIMHGGASTTQSFVQVSVDGGEPPASNIRIYSNTYYSSAAVPSGQFIMVDIPTSLVSNITIANNLAYAPNSISPVFYTNAGASNVVVSNNSTNSQIKNTSPLFAATPPSLITDWIPAGGSYTINAGTTVPVWSDFFLNSRSPGAMDMGAVEVP